MVIDYEYGESLKVRPRRLLLLRHNVDAQFFIYLTSLIKVLLITPDENYIKILKE